MDGSDVIEYFDRYSGTVRQERVYGGAWLNWAYGKHLGRVALHVIAKRALFSRWYGWRMDRSVSRLKVQPFIDEFGLDVSEFAEPPESYRTFNEFFYRKLKPGARPVDEATDSVVFPADGRHLGFQDVSKIDGVFVKGQRFDLPALIGDRELAGAYANGTLVLSRLCPVDYHRFHFAAGGTPGPTRLLNGLLFSVNPIALKQRIAYLWENRRWLTILESPTLGRVLLLEIGATNVGSAEQTYRPGTSVAKGDEKGYFKFGGSSTITIFEPGRVELAADLVENSRVHRELYAHVGDRMGRAVRAP